MTRALRVLLVAWLMAGAAQAQDAVPITQRLTIDVGVYEGGWPPFDIVQGGHVSGLGWDYAQRTLGGLGYTLRVHTYSDWPALLRAACANDIDLVLDVTPSQRKSSCFVFSEPYLEALPVVVARKDSRIHDDDDLATARVATARDFSVAEGVASLYPKATRTDYDTPSDALDAVRDGRADAYVANPYAVRSLLSRRSDNSLHVVAATQLPFDTVRFGLTRRAAALLPSIDGAIGEISTEDHAILRERWLGTLGGSGYVVPLSASERQTIAASGTLRVGYDPHAAPLSFTDNYGQVSGLSPAFLRQAAKVLGLRMRYVPTRDLSQALDMARHGQLDIVIGASRDPAQLPGFTYTVPVTGVPLVAVMRRDSPATSSLSSLAGRRIGLGVAVAEARPVVEGLTRGRTLSQESAEAGLAAVARGDLDVYIDNFAVVDPYLNHRYAGQLKVAATPSIELGASFALAPHVASLAPLLDRALESMPAAEQSLLRRTWIQRGYGAPPTLRALVDRFGVLILALAISVLVLLVAYLRLRAEASRRRVAEDLAKASGQSLAIIASNLPGLVFKLWQAPDGTLHFPQILGRAEPLFGLTAEEMMADEPRLFATVHPDDQPLILDAVTRSAETMEPFLFDFRTRLVDGERWVRSSATPRSRGAEGVSWSGFWIDVTDKYVQAEALERARSDAEAAADAKGRFLATMSHELRTPMHGIVGMLEVLRDMPLGADQARILDVVAESADSLRVILDDVLDFSQLDEGRLRLDMVDTDLRDLVDGTVMGLMGDATAKGLVVDVHVDPRVAAICRTDPTRVRQILVNLFGNAVKFTPTGFVRVAVEAVGADATGTQEVRLSVCDSGIGISPEQQASLFDAFTQAHAGIHRHFGGSGLGLAICRSLADLLGGRLRVESNAGEGTTVTLTMPVAVVRQHREDLPLRGLRFRALDGRRAEQLPVLARLERLGARSTSGDADADFAIAVEGGMRDTGLPLLSLTRIYHPGGYRPRGREADLCLHPLSARALVAAVRSLLPDAVHAIDPDEGVALVSRAAAEGWTADVLVVEDNAVNRELARLQLETLGLGCRLVDSGEEALDLLHRERFGVVLTDLFLGGMDGYAWSELHRRRELAQGLPRLPILMISASVIVDDEAMERRALMDGRLVKPLRKAALREALQRYFEPAAARDSSVHTLDLGAAIEDFGSEVVAKKVLRATVTSCTDDLARWPQADDGEARALWIHRVVGAVAMFGPPSLVENGRALENRLRDPLSGDALAASDDFVGAIRDWVAAAEQRLAEPGSN